jgi:ABC-type uncharacterized transport system auxiliary subunit
MNGPSPSARALPALLALLLAGCGNVLTSEQPARHHYLLSPYEASPAQIRQETGPELTLSLAAIPGLDTDRILALGVDARLNHYANARWPDHLPEVLASVIRRSLEATGRYAAVREAEPGATDGWALDLEVREFYGIQDASGATTAVRVALAGTLACGGATHALHLSAATPVAEVRLAAVVAAHQAGLDGVTRQLIGRIEALCAAPEDAKS